MGTVTSFPLITTPLNNVVRTDIDQSLTASEQKQARENSDAARASAANVLDFGAVGDGVTDDTSAFLAAIATGLPVFVPNPDVKYRVTQTLTPQNNQRIFGDSRYRTEIRLESASVSILFSLSNRSNIVIEHLRLDGAGAKRGGAFIDMQNSIACRLSNLSMHDMPGTGPGSIQIYGNAVGNIIEYCDSYNSESTCFGIYGDGRNDAGSCRYNEIRDCFFENSGIFGVRIGSGGYANRVIGCSTKNNGGELIGIVHGASHNQVMFNRAEGTHDNGISLSGSYNVCVGNICRKNDRAGIWCWGSFNTVVGNELLSNNQNSGGGAWAGVGVSANYGGSGEYNIIDGNTFDDDQAVPTQVPIRLSGNNYTQWAAGQAITVGVSGYRYYGNNIYYAQNSGTTGATPPTHTTGTASDGAVSWGWVGSVVGSAFGGNNTIGANTIARYSTNAQMGAFATDRRINGDGANIHGKVVVGGGYEASWTNVNDFTVRNSGNAGIAIESGAASIGRLAFGDGALAGGLEYNHSVDGLSFLAGGTARLLMTATALRPTDSGGLTLGVGSSPFGNAFLAADTKIDWGNGNVTVTHSTDLLTFNKGVSVLGAIQLANNQHILWTGRSRLRSNGDGNIVLLNNAASGFTDLCFGGLTSSFPALRVAGADLQAKLADNSGYANLDVLALKVSGTKVLGARDTGWTASAGTGSKGGVNMSWTQTISASPTKTEVEALVTQLSAVSKLAGQMQAAITTHGMIGT